ncbi:glycosyl hydrolase family 28-related protein [Actinopolymorpha sp. B11F2]|uniref:glycoside hydrolase family 28 protein n=1 Tax=Actinopolymorpha sp. B11F2 TaxID=3160862 RepID=UPI0032E4EF8C
MGGASVAYALGGTGAAHAAVPVTGSTAEPSGGTPDGWGKVGEILARVRPPTFPDRDFSIASYGAVGDGQTDCTASFAAAIDACAGSGGGRVLVPAGTYATGPIHLRSKVNLHVSAGATISFSRDRDRYLPVVYSRYEGVELMNRSAPIYAYRQRNIALTGEGVIDGRADAQNWWNLAGSGGEAPDKALLNQMAEDGVPVQERVFGEGHSLRVNLVQLYECENVLVDGVTVMNSPMWHIHPVLCENVLIQNVTVRTPDGPNTFSTASIPSPAGT